MHTYIHTYIHTYAHTYVHTCIHAYMHTDIHTCIRYYLMVRLHPDGSTKKWPGPNTDTSGCAAITVIRPIWFNLIILDWLSLRRQTTGHFRNWSLANCGLWRETMNLPPCPAGNFSTNMNKILPYATGDASLCTKVEYPCLGSDVVLRVSDPVRLQPPWITPLWKILNSSSRIRNETIISVRVEGPTRRCHSLDSSYFGCNQGFHAWSNTRTSRKLNGSSICARELSHNTVA